MSDPAKPIRLSVLFFGAARDAVGVGEIVMSPDTGTTSSQLIEAILNKFPELRRFGSSLHVAVNQEYVRGERELNDGDELAIFPPVSGGAT